jgi:hypothetical protein
VRSIRERHTVNGENVAVNGASTVYETICVRPNSLRTLKFTATIYSLFTSFQLTHTYTTVVRYCIVENPYNRPTTLVLMRLDLLVENSNCCMIRCFGPAMGHRQYWKASPVDTTLLAFGVHKEFVLKLGLWGGHTLSREERRCLAGPKLQEVTETYT